MPVKDSPCQKIVIADGYNMIFNKQNGTMLRWGNTYGEDPQLAPLGPEILDLEISVGDCSGKCPWCYKSNMTGKGKHMTLETFKAILEKVGNQLTQVAFGITDADSNPDFPDILRHCREQGVIPNYTTSGLGMTKALFSLSAEVCGAVAVSVYPHNREMAYGAIDKFLSAGIEQTNIHLLYYKKNLQFVYEVLHDVAWNKISPHAVVLLALKATGRGSDLTSITEKQFGQLVDSAIEDNIPLGFDSCSAPKFERWAKENGKSDLIIYSEPCESGLMSSYINVDGDFFPCSFVEGTAGWEQGISVLDCKDFLRDVWFHLRTNKWRERLLSNNRCCPVFEL